MSKNRVVRMLALSGLLLAVLVSSAACCCLLANRRSPRPTPTARAAGSARATATLWPTATPSDTPAPALPLPTATPIVLPTALPVATLAPTLPAAVQPNTPVPPAPPVAPVAPEIAPGIPGTPNTPFDVLLTESQLNEYVGNQVLSAQGVEVSDPQVALAEDALLVHVNAFHSETNISMGLTVRGTPNVVDGALYVRVDDVTIDDNVRGFTRLLAGTLIETALKQYAGENGIPVPFDQVLFEQVEVTSSGVRIVGRTR
ncbi:MAG: hypothetical protein GX557_09465 [Chloroflexi bacterium]|nr:hypothetical protein [Chloroflexota bacterium]